MNNYQTEFKVENGILHVNLSGEFPDELLNQLDNLFQPLVDACTAENCKRVLIDARNLKTDFKVNDIFKAGKDASTLSCLNITVALLTSFESLDFLFEHVANNRGGNIAIFTEMDKAIEWLQK